MRLTDLPYTPPTENPPPGRTLVPASAMDGTEHPERSARRGWRRWLPTHKRFVTWLIVVLAAGLVGSAFGPGWNPQPMTAAIAPQTSDTTIFTGVPTARLGTYEVASSTVTVTLRDGTPIPAVVKRPVGAGPVVPGMLFIHGTGTSSARDFGRETEAIASTGIVTVVPEKRVANYTTTHRDYLQLAADFEDVYREMLSWDDVDARHSGLYAVSEGCFVAPIVATSARAVNYVALISAPVLPIRQQGAYAADAYLREIHAPERLRAAIPKLIGQDFGPDTFRYIDFDAAPYEKRMTMPVLMLYGTADNSMPTIQGPQMMSEYLEEAGNSALTVRYYKDADHGLQINRRQLSRAAMQDTADWVNGLPFTATAQPRVAGDQPRQAFVAPTLTAGGWFTAQTALYIALGGVALLGLSIVLVAVCWIPVRGHRLSNFSGSGAALNLASLSVVGAWAVFLVYLVAVAHIALTYSHNLLIVQGGFALVHLAALGAAWMHVRAAFRSWKARPGMGRIARVTTLLTLCAQAVLLLSLGYWNAFPAVL
ncbi:acyl-CoA thioester hydrolase/BAAT C-terminal domain-containing protein [Actinotignum schaalii]|uniref:alpha/beta hydrolase family protein n=1 Tax=Actinotignum schaalii TaxID=59505 RepID=UPI00237E4381|nr:acyl-CoA thioester hydrolase/BAAT C-terminal domain-containing protein [Actinotignum schaalii]MDE1653838.1 acyl-CoA thioester hydrolase/BAAT C-terminal domain-containing protein [Actinotignum schaalii]